MTHHRPQRGEYEASAIAHRNAVRSRLMRAAPEPAIFTPKPPKPKLPMRRSRLRQKLVFDGNVSHQPIATLRFPITDERRVKLIIAAVCCKHGVSRMDVMSPRRNRHITDARQEAMWRVYTKLPFSLPHIGKIFGRDHTTVLHAIRRFQQFHVNSKP